MFFHGVQEVEFVGGPLDGYRQTMRQFSDDWQEVIVIPVNVNVFRLLAGLPLVSKSPASSCAVYELRKHKAERRYQFTEAKSPKEFDRENQRI